MEIFRMKKTRRLKVRGKPLGKEAMPAIITPLVGRTSVEVLNEVAAIVPKKPDLLEWRVDYFQAIGDIPAVIGTAQAIRHAADGIPVLLTRRKESEGGQPLTIGEPAVVAMYAAACEAECVELIDYELSNDPKDIAMLRAVSKKKGIGMILSFHDFQATPDAATLDDRFLAARKLGADAGKVAVMPADERDVLALLAATSRARAMMDIPLISVSMGSVGALSRIAGWNYGSAATFAVGGSRSAPGQMAIEELRAALASCSKNETEHEIVL
jgi:3-dehydroquinate dehydratase-1